MISIIIPFRDHVDLLDRCVSSVNLSDNVDYKVVLVNNQSRKRETLEYIKIAAKKTKSIVLDYEEPFNFSAINNFAAKQTKGEYLLFLNNDTEVISGNWLEGMMKCFEDEKVGVVGAELLYPNGTIQHAGVMLEKKRLAIHAFRTWKEDKMPFDEPKEWSAVTAACMMTRKDLFEKVGGFDEKNLPIAYNDVDYCLKIRELGYKILCTPYVKLYHYESASRKSDVLSRIFNRSRYKKFLAEQEYMRRKWSHEINNDPFYNNEFV